MMGSYTPGAETHFQNPKQRIGRSFVTPAATRIDEAKSPFRKNRKGLDKL
jgi:hypothetical protein